MSLIFFTDYARSLWGFCFDTHATMELDARVNKEYSASKNAKWR